MSKFVIGIDYGTLSARALLVNVQSGKEIACSEFVYPHAIMENVGGERVPENFGIQHPQDYLDALKSTIRDVLTQSSVSADDVVGLGIDFTTCTVLPVDKNLKPLCFDQAFNNNPHAFVKLWKHHGAEKEAQIIEQTAIERKEKWIKRYGGKISSEYLFPKILETFNKAKTVFDKAENFIEACDWLVSLIVGKMVKSNCLAGYKACWSQKEGYPTKEFWAQISEEFSENIFDKIKGDIMLVGNKAGEITEAGERFTGLRKGTAVAVGVGDAHAFLPSAGVTESGKLVLILGTSACHILLDKKEVEIDGLCGRVVDGIIPGYVSYEAGQTCFGDAFDWTVKTIVPDSYYKEANKQGKGIFQFITEKAENLKVGEGGLLAIDWFNGNRSPYFDFELSGAILGINLSTKPEHVYRAIVEANAFGTKRIVDIFKEGGIDVNQVIAAGGIAKKSPFIMQVLADVLGVKISVVDSEQAGAKGSSVYAAVASGYYESIQEASKIIANKYSIEYLPNTFNTEKYAKLYSEYVELSEYFANKNGVLKRIKNI